MLIRIIHTLALHPLYSLRSSLRSSLIKHHFLTFTIYFRILKLSLHTTCKNKNLQKLLVSFYKASQFSNFSLQSLCTYTHSPHISLLYICTINAPPHLHHFRLLPCWHSFQYSNLKNIHIVIFTFYWLEKAVFFSSLHSSW